MSCNKCHRKNCNCNKGCSSIVVDGNYVYQAWATDENGSNFSLTPFQSDGTKYPYTAVIISHKKIDRLQPSNFEGRWFPTSYDPNGIQIGDNISLLNNDVPYLKPNDNISELNNDVPYLKNGDNISELNNDEGYIKDSQGVTDALGYIPEDSANKNQPGGYPTLDENGLVPPNQLPQITLNGQIFVYENEAEMNASTDNINGNLAVLQNPTGTSKSYLWYEGVWLPVSAYNVSSINGLTGDITGVLFETDLSAENGITYNNGNFKLGGTLNQFSTDIDANFNNFRIFGGGGNFFGWLGGNFQLNTDFPANTSGDFKFIIANGNNAQLGFRDGTRFIFYSKLANLGQNSAYEGDILYDSGNDNPINRGIYYQSDYSINWGNLTPPNILATKGYVDRLLGGLISDNLYTADGSLTSGRTVNLNDFNLTFFGQGSENFNVSNVSQINLNTLGSGKFGINNGRLIFETSDSQYGMSMSSDEQTIVNKVFYVKADEQLTLVSGENFLLMQENQFLIGTVDKTLKISRDTFPNNSSSIQMYELFGSEVLELNSSSNVEVNAETRFNVVTELINLVVSDIMTIRNSNTDATKRGAKYEVDYSEDWDNTTPNNYLTTKGYVDRLISLVETFYNTDGTLTSDRILDTNGNDLKFIDALNQKTIFEYVEFKGDKILSIGSALNSDSNQILNAFFQASNFIGINVGSFIDGDRYSISISEESIAIEQQFLSFDAFQEMGIYVGTEFKIYNRNSDVTQRGAKYSLDYSNDWNETTPSSMLSTKGYVDRKTLYTIRLGRNGNVNSNAYLRCSGNVVCNASRGEIISTNSKLEKFSYRVNSANGVGAFSLVIRHISNTGSLLNEAVLNLSAIGSVNSFDLSPALLGWNGLVNENEMIAIQFRTTGSPITQINNVQVNLTMSVQ